MQDVRDACARRCARGAGDQRDGADRRREGAHPRPSGGRPGGQSSTGAGSGAAAGGGSRLLNLNQAAGYLGLSYWSVRDMVQSGMLQTVRFPAPRARDGRAIRRILVDREDLDRLVEQWKERSVS
jgi:hypothetical protein